MKHLLLIVGLIMALGCETTPLEVSIPQQQQKTVVFSQVIPDRVMVVALTKSFEALALQEEEGDSISTGFLSNLLEDNAEVTISYDGHSDTLQQIEKGLYASISTPQNSGVLYSLKIRNDRGELVSAEGYMLPKVDFKTIKPKVNVSDDDTTIIIDYSFEDKPEERNWYMINFYKRGRNLEGLDVNTIFSNGQNNLVHTEIISDATFGGVYFGKNEFDGLQISPNDTIAVSLSNIDEEYFKFLDLRKRGGNLFSEITREPISYPTNVTNGYGFFNTHSPDIEFFDLNKY